MAQVWLVHWRRDEGTLRAEELKAQGFNLRYRAVDPGALLSRLKAAPPDALVIDLTRSPSLGRDLAVALRVRGGTRAVPLVFAGGHPDEVAGVRQVIPDAAFAPWEEVGTALLRVIESPPENPVVPSSALAGYSGTPLPKKLGIKEGTRLLLARPPEGFLSTLGSLPAGVELRGRYSSTVDLVIWFVRSRKELKGGIRRWADRTGKGGLWIAWPKKASGMAPDLSQALVRSEGLDHGLVDYKIAALDEIWSGLKFARRSA